METNVSFIIPAFNEEKYIPLCLNSIHEFFKGSDYEIIVVDNGSTDSTATIAEKSGAAVIFEPKASISKLRNIGVSHSTGNLLIFLDADIELTQQWHNEFKKINQLVLEQPILAGSQAAVPDDSSFIEYNWFDEFHKREEVNHLGSAHLIISRKNFDLIGGFNESLETGEDYDFCQRALSLSVEIQNNLELKVIHYGFPKTFRHFVKRESWHGKSDFTSLKRILDSKVAIATLVFLITHITLLFGLVTGECYIAIASFIMIFVLLVVSTLQKYSHSIWQKKISNIMIFYFYYIGRTWSFFKVLSEKII